MKTTLLSLLFLLALSVNTVFAATPIPGINIIMKECYRNGVRVPCPKGGGTNMQTGNDGKTSIRFEEGKYDLSISYDQVMAVIARIDKNKVANNGNYKIQLTLDPDTVGNITLDGNTLPKTIEITPKTGTIPLLVSAKGGTIRFTLTFDSGRFSDKPENNDRSKR